MSEPCPEWDARAVWPAEGLTPEEAALTPRAWWFRASDDYPMAVLSWRSETATARARVVVLHGVQSHAGWYHGLGRRLAAAGYEAHFPDRRGSGANGQDRGHAASAARLLADISELIGTLKGGGEIPTVVAGISWGGKLAVVCAARFPELIDALVLICPGLYPRVTVTLGEKLGVAWAMASGRAASRRFAIPLADSALFTANPAARKFISEDPLSLREATAGLLFASRSLDRWLAREAEGVRAPVLLLLAERDLIIDNARTSAYLKKLANAHTTTMVLAGANHTPEFEADPGTYVREVIRWIEEAVSIPKAKRSIM